MRKVVTCPVCNGQRFYKRPLNFEWDEPELYAEETCYQCGGIGEISQLSYAIYATQHPLSDFLDNLENW